MKNSTARQLEGTRFPSDLERIDAARLRHHLGEDAYRSFEQLRRLTDVLEGAGYIWRKSGRWELTARAIRRIGQKALRDIFGCLKKGRLGTHEMATRFSPPGWQCLYLPVKYPLYMILSLLISHTAINSLSTLSQIL